MLKIKKKNAIEALKTLEGYCRGRSCGDCEISKWCKDESSGSPCGWEIPSFRPQPTNDEKAILRSVDRKYKWVARDKDNELFVYENKPLKAANVFSNSGGKYEGLIPFQHLFQFIEWEDGEPCLVEDLLRG